MLRFDRLSLLLACTSLLFAYSATAEEESGNLGGASVQHTAPSVQPPASSTTSADTPTAPVQKKVEVKGIEPTKNWVSDRVETQVRSCPTDKCRIVKLVRPGNEITVLGYTPDGWAYVAIGDIKGFILKRYLQDAPMSSSGSECRGANDVFSTMPTSSKSEVEALRKRTETAETETGVLRKENYELKQELDYVKGLSNQTLMVNEENRRLKTEVEVLRQRNEILEQEARDGEGRDQRAWVIVGAGIILVGWFLGRFARLPRRKSWNQM